jgi:hypothetical protein
MLELEPKHLKVKRPEALTHPPREPPNKSYNVKTKTRGSLKKARTAQY